MTPLPERNAEILKMLGDGKKQREVAKHFKTTRSAVAAVVRRSKSGYHDSRSAASILPPPKPEKPAEIIVDRAADRQLIAEYLALNGAKKCPTVALVATQAALQNNPGINDRLGNRTGWPMSDEFNQKRNRKGTGGSTKGCRIGSVI